MHALENVIALIAGEKHGYRFGKFKQWEADFLRHLLGFTTFAEEKSFNQISQETTLSLHCCWITYNEGWKEVCISSSSWKSTHKRDVSKWSSRHGSYFWLLQKWCSSYGTVCWWKVVWLFPAGQQQTTFLCWGVFEGQVDFGWRSTTMDDLHWMHSGAFYRNSSTNWVFPQVLNSWTFCLWMDFSCDRSTLWEVNLFQGLDEIQSWFLAFVYDNDGQPGYIWKGAGTRPPRQYDTTRYCILNLLRLIRDGSDLSWFQLVWFWSMMIFLRNIFTLWNQFLYVGFNAFSRTSGHGLSPEIRFGTWRSDMTIRQKYEEYLSSDEISKYLEHDKLVEWRIPKNNPPKEKTNSMGVHGPASTWKIFGFDQQLVWWQKASRCTIRLSISWGSWFWSKHSWSGCWDQHIEQCGDSSCSDYFWEPLTSLASRSVNTERQQGCKSHQSLWWACVDHQRVFHDAITTGKLEISGHYSPIFGKDRARSFVFHKVLGAW